MYAHTTGNTLYEAIAKSLQASIQALSMLLYCVCWGQPGCMRMMCIVLHVRCDRTAELVPVYGSRQQVCCVRVGGHAMCCGWGSCITTVHKCIACIDTCIVTPVVLKGWTTGYMLSPGLNSSC